MKILIIDNYDSFTYNLYQSVGELLESLYSVFTLKVRRNDETDINTILLERNDGIIISPGPGDASDKKYFGVCGDVIAKAGIKTPVLGVCLGMQGIAYAFGGNVERAGHPMHGKTSSIRHDEKGVFKNLPQKIEVMRYHSLVVREEGLPQCLEITARAEDGTDKGEIMGLRHREYPIEGVQFHPESFATEGGKIMLKNFLFNAGAKRLEMDM